MNADPTQIIEQAVSTMTTEQLLLAMDLIDQQDATTEDDRIIRSAMRETVEARHNLSAAIDAIYDIDFEGTYTDALRIALAEVAA